MTGRRNALRLGLVASAVALSGRGTARAADALTIGPNGVNIDNLDVAKSLTVRGPMKIDGKNTLEFGAGLPNKGEAFNGRIGYEAATPGALDILGAGTAADGSDRKIKFQAQGGATLDGSLTVSKSLTVEGDATLQKSLTVTGDVKIDGKRVLEFGAGVTGKQVDAGKICYQVYNTDALGIIGAGTAETNRKIKFWAEGGATLTGSLTVSGKGEKNVDLIVSGRLRSDNNDGGLWVASDRFVGGHDTNKIGFYNNDAWRLAVHNNGDVEIPGSLFVTGNLALRWKNSWREVQPQDGGTFDRYLFLKDSRSPSDIRFKTALRPIRNALEKVLQLNGTCYRWGEAGLRHFTQHITDEFSAGPDASADDNQKVWDAERRIAYDALSGDQIGLIAQELETVVPELVHEDKEGYKYIQYPQLTALLVEAIKEQNALIQSLSGKLAALEGR
jgi:hypothetical protein